MSLRAFGPVSRFNIIRVTFSRALLAVVVPRAGAGVPVLTRLLKLPQPCARSQSSSNINCLINSLEMIRIAATCHSTKMIYHKMWRDRSLMYCVHNSMYSQLNTTYGYLRVVLCSFLPNKAIRLTSLRPLFTTNRTYFLLHVIPSVLSHQKTLPRAGKLAQYLSDFSLKVLLKFLRCV